MLGSVARGGGRRPGGASAPAPGARGGRADRVAAGLPVDRRHPARDRRAALGPRAPRDLRRRVAARAARHRRRTTTRPRQAEIADSLSLAFLVLLESLSPEQRAVFLLRDVFDYPYDRIAAIVGKSEAPRASSRSRARRHVERAPAALRGLARAARRAGRALLRRGRGGRPRGARGAARRGRRAARRRRRQGPGARARRSTAAPASPGRSPPGARRRRGSAASRSADARSTASPARSSLDAGRRLISVLALEIAGGRVQAISSVVNPDKLRHLGPVADLTELLARGP